jgi:peptidyl-prolyl cis-trans isomerase D
MAKAIETHLYIYSELRLYMLQTMRENMKGTVAILIVGFLGLIMALSLVDLSGSGGYDQNFNDVAEVNGNKISERELQIALQQERQRLQGQFGNSLPAEFLSEDRLRTPALQGLIQRSVVQDRASKSGMTISDEALDKFITAQPQFQTDGRFDPEVFIQGLRASNYTPASYRAQLKQSLAAEQFLNVFSTTGFVTQEEVEKLYGLSRQSRNFSWLSLPIADLPATIIVTADDIQKTYEAEKANFNTLEQVAVEFIELKVSDFTDDIEISGDDVLLRFEQEQKQNSAIEREVAHIMIDADNALADENIALIEEKLSNGSVDFEDLAREYSDDFASKESGGNLGISNGSVFPPKFERVLEELKVGEVSGPVLVDNATHFIKLVSTSGGKDNQSILSADDKNRIESQLKNLEAEQIFIEKLAELTDLAYNADSLVDVADQLSLKSGETDLFSRTGGNDEILNDGRVVSAAFSDQVLLENFSSEIIEIAPNHAIVIKLIKHEPVRTQTLNEKTADIIAALKIERAKSQLAKQAESLKTELAQGKALADIAADNNLIVNSESNITRENRTLDAQLVSHVFTLDKLASKQIPVTSSLYLANNDYVLMSLNTVTNADFTVLSEAEKRAARNSLTEVSLASEFRAWQAELIKSADIEMFGAAQ